LKVIVPRYSGFCPGVSRAARRLFDRLKGSRETGGLYILGELIHNTRYIEHLRGRGISTASRMEDLPARCTVAIRTHGVPRDMEDAMRHGRQVIDLTCFKVKKLQEMIREHAERGYFIVIAGKASHPEVRSLTSYADVRGGAGWTVLESRENLRTLLASIHNRIEDTDEGASGRAGVLVVSQTTGSRELFAEAAEAIEGELDGAVKVVDTICEITSLREGEALERQREVDATFVVGDRLSSNAGRLFRTLRSESERTFFVQDLKELRGLGLPLDTLSSCQVVSSSSTPEFVEEEIVRYLKSL